MAGTLTYGAEARCDRLFSDDQETAEGIRQIQACLTAGDASQALTACDRMLSLRPGDRLFEGLKLEAENKERELRLEFVRRLSSDLEHIPDLDLRIHTIQQALERYPAESQLLELLKNATARRDFFHALISEARQEELSERYTGALRPWHLIRDLHPTMPGLDEEIHRVESLAEIQRKLRRRAEFIEAIFRLSSTGDYTRAVFECANALAEYPNDGGLLSLRQSIEEKAQHSTELQNFVSEGLTFLKGHETDAALESFAKARALDQGNLQVRYLIGIALLEKARTMMSDDRRKLNVLLEEVRNFVPNHPELQSLAFNAERLPDEESEQSLIRIDPPVIHTPVPAKAAQSEPPREEPAPQVVPPPAQSPGFFRRIAPFGLLVLGAFIIGALVYFNRPKPEASDRGAVPALPAAGIPAANNVAALTDIPDASATPLAVHVVTDQPSGGVWMDGQIQGSITDHGITISGVTPGVHAVRIPMPAGDVEIQFEFSPGKTPAPQSLPPRQIANVLFAGSAGETSRVACNCAPFGLRVGDRAELIREEGLEIPLVEGPHPAELWLGRNHRKLTLHGGRSPVATIAVFSSIETVPSVANR